MKTSLTSQSNFLLRYLPVLSWLRTDLIAD